MTGRLLVAVAICAAIAVACSPGISQERAVELAMKQMGSAATHVEWVRRGTLAQFTTNSRGSEDADRQIWAVRLAGRWDRPCPYTPSRPEGWCADLAAGGATILLDAFDGQVLEIVLT